MLSHQLHKVWCRHEPRRLNSDPGSSCLAEMLWNCGFKPFFLWKSFCINSLTYLFRHLERTPNPTSTFFIREKHLLPDWPVIASRGWWQPSPCSQEDWEVLPSRNVPTLGIQQAQLKGATKLQWCWGQGWGSEGCRDKPPPSPEGTCSPKFFP